MREMCKVFRGLSLHTSTNPTARTTNASPGMSHELLPGIFLLEVFQVKPICFVTLGDMQGQFDYQLSKLTILELDALAYLVQMHRGEEE